MTLRINIDTFGTTVMYFKIVYVTREVTLSVIIHALLSETSQLTTQ